MDKKNLIILGFLGIFLTIILFIFNIYLAGIVFILLITVFMSLLIMQDSVSHPDMEAFLSDDAKAIIIKNSGNAPALHIHVALVPMNTEYDVSSLAVEETHSHRLESMITDVKVVITYENEDKLAFSRTFSLSALSNQYEPFKPMIPMFKWK
jgi:hypothetical protein